MISDACIECKGTGSTDNGGNDAQGNFYLSPCSACLGTGRESVALLDWSVTLLCSATPAKVLDEKQSEEWCQGFGKWFAHTQELLGKLRKATQP